MDTTLDPWREWNRECTSFVAWRLHSKNGFDMPFHGNASTWAYKARNLHYRVDSVPTVGSVASFSYGHVAWVEAVNGNSVTIEDYNWNRAGHYGRRTVQASAARYIHFRDLIPKHYDSNGDGRADLVVVSEAASHQIEAGILDGKAGYTTWLAQPSTAAYYMAYTDKAMLGDVNGDGRSDLVIAETFDTGSGKINLHVLDGAKNYASWLGHYVTAADYVSPSAKLLMGDVNGDGKSDLIIVNGEGTSSGRLEAHILDGSSGYKGWLGHYVTAADYLSSGSQIEATDINGDGRSDLAIVLNGNTNSGKIEVHALDATSDYTNWLGHWATSTDSSKNSDSRILLGDVNGDGKADLVLAKTTMTKSGKTELVVLDGASGYINLLGNSITSAGILSSSTKLLVSS